MFLFLLDALVRERVNTCGFTVLYDDNVICPARRQKHEPVHRVLKLAACTQDTLEKKISAHGLPNGSPTSVLSVLDEA